MQVQITLILQDLEFQVKIKEDKLWQIYQLKLKCTQQQMV
jgi:hypothetical protein